MNEKERVRKRVDKILRQVEVGWRFKDEGEAEHYKYLDQILSIKGLAVLSDDQSLPKTYFENRRKMPWITDHDVEVQAQQDMKDFRRIVNG